MSAVKESAVEVPDWRKVYDAIPADFRDNGVSSPFFFLYPFVGILRVLLRMDRDPRQFGVDLNEGARLHDFGYGPARLPGSGFERITKDGWDRMYGAYLKERKHKWTAKLHPRVLRSCGQKAWDDNWRQMIRWEWITYADFLRDPDHNYKSSGGGAIR